MNFLKKLFLNAQNQISWTKVGGALVGITGTIIALPAAGVALPLVLVADAKVVLAIAATIGIAGARDALDKNKTDSK